MTTLIEDLQAVLNPLAANGAFYGMNTLQPPQYPYISWQRIVSTPNVSLQGPSLAQSTRVQMNIYAQRISDAAAIETALEAAMQACSIVNVPVLSMDLYEPEVRAFRVIKEYSCWASN